VDLVKRSKKERCGFFALAAGGFELAQKD